MREKLITLIIFLFSSSLFAQQQLSTNPKEIKRFEKKAKRNPPISDDEPYVWRWQSKDIEIDSLDFINPTSSLLPKSSTIYSPQNGNINAFEYIRIDSIESQLVIFRNWTQQPLESFLTDENLSKNAGEIYGYIIDQSPTLVFGNSAKNFFKASKRVKMSSPYSPRIISGFYSNPIYNATSFFIVKADSLQEINTGNDPYIGTNQHEYYEYIKRNLPIDQKFEISPWKSPIKIDSLELINHLPILYTENNEYNSPFQCDPLSFNYIRIDSIESHLVLFKGWYPKSIEKFLTENNKLEESGKLYGYSTNNSPTLIFGNMAHIFFKITKRTKLTSPYPQQTIENYKRKPFKEASSFFIIKNGELEEIKITHHSYYTMNENEYYKTIKRYLPKK